MHQGKCVQRLRAFVHSIPILVMVDRFRQRKRTQGRPNAHFPLITAAIEEFAAWTLEFTMYTPYLFSKVVLVPFQAVIPPPHERRGMDVSSTHAVPKP